MLFGGFFLFPSSNAMFYPLLEITLSSYVCVCAFVEALSVIVHNIKLEVENMVVAAAPKWPPVAALRPPTFCVLCVCSSAPEAGSHGGRGALSPEYRHTRARVPLELCSRFGPHPLTTVVSLGRECRKMLNIAIPQHNGAAAYTLHRGAVRKSTGTRCS